MPSPDDPALFQADEDEASTTSPAQDPALPQEWEDDDSLIRWMLSLTPTERLQRAQGFVNGVRALRHGRRS